MTGSSPRDADALVRAAPGGPSPEAVGTQPVLGRPAAEWAARTRSELGLPSGAVVGAGHQPEWWHPGIVAKFVWADERARRADAALAWLVVDTDARDPGTIRFPELRAGRVAASEARFGPPMPQGASPAAMPAFRPRGVPEPRPGRASALPCVEAGLARAHAALAAHTGAPDGVEQVMDAVRECTPEVGAPSRVVRTSQVMSTGLGRALVGHALADPAACARAFNRAVAHAPRAARPLAESGPRGAELPFWAPDAAGRRTRVHADELRGLVARGAPLWPRAFVTGMFARLALFDRFVHGTGGESYERATDELAAAWLGVRLPAFDVATATLRLPFGVGPDAVGADALRIAWFDPEGGRGGPGPRKRAMLEAIAAAPRGSAARRAAWREMHATLGEMRAADAEGFRRLAAAADDARARMREDAVRADRTWPAVLHPPGAVSRLAASIRSLPT